MKFAMHHILLSCPSLSINEPVLAMMNDGSTFCELAGGDMPEPGQRVVIGMPSLALAYFIV